MQIVPVADKFDDYAYKIRSQLNNAGFRVRVDTSDDSFSKKIRNAEIMKVPYMLIVGENEQGAGTVSVRKHGGTDLGTMSTEAFIAHITAEVNEQLNKNEY